MEEIKIRELPEKSNVNPTDYIPVEDVDGTKKVLIKQFRSLVLNSLYFNTINDLKNSTSTALKEGDVCETLGYTSPGDGGGAKYQITYNPAAVEDGKLVHYLSYSDTLRAELIESDTINVHQFGAVGDGKTDDTDAIQAALDYAESKVVEFTNNKSYVIRNPLNIHNSNTVIHGNGGILFPHYVDGIKIEPKEETEERVHDVVIDRLHFDCSKATSAISAYNTTKVDILGSNFSHITSKGISLKNTSFVNISKCQLDGKELCSSILLEGSEDGTINVVDIPVFGDRVIKNYTADAICTGAADHSWITANIKVDVFPNTSTTDRYNVQISAQIKSTTPMNINGICTLSANCNGSNISNSYNVQMNNSTSSNWIGPVTLLLEASEELDLDLLINRVNLDLRNIIGSNSKPGIYHTSDDGNITNFELLNKRFVVYGKINRVQEQTLEDSNNVSARFININNCRFNDFSKAIHVLSTGSVNKVNTLANIDNCQFYSNVKDASCIYTACEVEMISIKSAEVYKTDTFLNFGGASKGNVSCRDISCVSTSKVFNIGSSLGVLTLEGTIKADSTAVIFENMMGKLQSNIVWDLVDGGASFTNAPIGELFDAIHPEQYRDNTGYSISTNKLILGQVRNMHINWSSSSKNIEEILNGVNGQLLYIKSSTNKSIIADTNKIILSRPSVVLGPYNGILLRYDGVKWIQIEDVAYAVANNAPSVVSEDAISTYDVWKSLGNEGGPQEFIDSLKGEDGESGVGIADISSETDGKTITFTFLLDNGQTKTTSVDMS